MLMIMKTTGSVVTYLIFEFSFQHVLFTRIRVHSAHCAFGGPNTGPSTATAGPGKTLSRGPITTPTPILYVLISRSRKRREGGNVGRGVPSPSD